MSDETHSEPTAGQVHRVRRMVRTTPMFYLLLLAGTAAVLGLAVLLAASGISMANCLLVVTLAPVVSVVGYEVRGHRHAAQAVRNLHDQSHRLHEQQ